MSPLRAVWTACGRYSIAAGVGFVVVGTASCREMPCRVDDIREVVVANHVSIWGCRIDVSVSGL